MKRTISVMLGKGSISHNSRKFKAENIDEARTQYNISYCNQPIKEVYHELFDEALERYNAKQSRKDRRIDNYYEKIRTGDQEKLFHEVIFQVGNKENMAADSEEGKLAAKVLDEFMGAFQERNPNLRVFSAHLHMDEATPHLHIDFVPFTTGSNRGLDTRVSMKKALEVQGFTGVGRSETEWSKWVKSEKDQLVQVMERHGIEWEQLGTYDEHLSVLNYKKEQRAKEVVQLDKEIEKYTTKLENVKDEFKAVKVKEDFVHKNVRKYDDDPTFQLPEPKMMMSAKAYHDKIAVPLVNRLKKAIRGILLQFIDKVQDMQSKLTDANTDVYYLTHQVKKYGKEKKRLDVVEQNYKRVKAYLGPQETEKIVKEMEAQEAAALDMAKQHKVRKNQDMDR